jgi:hypothetical protein
LRRKRGGFKRKYKALSREAAQYPERALARRKPQGKRSKRNGKRRKRPYRRIGKHLRSGSA